MKLPAPSVRKLLRESFGQQSPIEVDLRNRPALIQAWREKLERVEGVRVTQHPGDRDPRSHTLLRFTVQNPHQSLQYWRTDEVHLDVDERSRLRLWVGANREDETTVLVSDLAEIEKLVRQVLVRYAKRHAAEKKREKIRKFQSAAILAQVGKLAGEEKFDFATVADSHKVRLFVRLSRDRVFEIHIPFKRFDETLPKLRSAVTTLRQLDAEGLRFRIAATGRLPRGAEWIRADGFASRESPKPD